MKNMISGQKKYARVIAVTVGLLFLAGCGDNMAKKDKMSKSMAHVHIGHVMTGWKDTPSNQGLLPTAIAEAKIAIQHAKFAAAKFDNMKWMKAHVAHVLHAVDPSAIAKGPGKGYGVIKAASGAAKHIGFSAKSEGASKNVKAHAVHVGDSTSNVVLWANEIVRHSKDAMASNSIAMVKYKVVLIKRLSGRLLGGYDANGDGRITWKKGEGGLNEAKKHMGFMLKGEGLKS